MILKSHIKFDRIFHLIWKISIKSHVYGSTYYPLNYKTDFLPYIMTELKDLNLPVIHNDINHCFVLDFDNDADEAEFILKYHDSNF